MKLQHYTLAKNTITILVCCVFFIFVFAYEYHVKHKSELLIQQHAKVIADSLWNVNMEGAAEYLRLAVVANQYNSLTVYEQLGVAFQTVNNEPPTRLELFLNTIKLTPKIQLKSDIVHEGNVIGQVEAVWMPPTIFTHINVLFVLTIITATFHLYLRTLMDKGVLEERVKARTAELAESNVSLRKEIHEKQVTASVLRKSEEEYRQLYEESQNAEEVYRSLIDSSADAILICDLNQNVNYLSSAFTDLFGWELQETKGKRIALFDENDAASSTNIFTDICENGASYQAFETHGLTKLGRHFDISVSGSRFNDHTGSPIGVLFVIRDISDQKRMERQLQRAERMEAVGTLAGGIAHDFNNLLMGIQGNVSLAMIELEADSPIQNRLQAIDKYVKSSEKLTGQLLGFARGGKYEVKVTDMNDLVLEESRLFSRTRKDITFTKEFQKNIWPVEVDRGQIRQVLLNLYVNAGQAMPEGGSLHLSSFNVFLDEIPYGSRKIPTGRYVQVSISDSGHGMEKRTMDRIFDPFFTTKELGRGTGLGLASTYGIIKNHKGFIDVSSDPGEGTTFTIYLPASEKPISGNTKAPDSNAVIHGKGLILLVDDEDMILEVGREILTTIGYEVETANSGEEACRIYREMGSQFSVVILDIIMPDMDGGMVFSELKKMNPEVKVLLSSGYSLDGKASGIMARGCAGFLQKPFDITTISKKLQEII